MLVPACWLVVTLLTAKPPPASTSASGPNPYMEQALRELKALDERSALKTLEKARAWRGNTVHEVALVHQYMGLAYAGLSQEADAMAAFRNAVVLEPTLELPPGQSPRIRQWWKRAGGVSPEPPPSPPPAPELSSEPLAPPPLQTAAVSPTPTEAAQESGPRWSAWTLGGVGVALAVAGVVFGALSSSNASAARAETDVYRAVRTHESAQHQAKVANLFFIGAGAAGAGSVTLFVF